MKDCVDAASRHGAKKNSKTLSCEGSIGLPLTRQTTRLLLRLAPKKQSLTRPRFARIGFVCPVVCERDAASRHGARTQNSSRETSLQRISRGLDTRALRSKDDILSGGSRPVRREKRTADRLVCCSFLERITGLEPATFALARRRSTK